MFSVCLICALILFSSLCLFQMTWIILWFYLTSFIAVFLYLFTFLVVTILFTVCCFNVVQNTFVIIIPFHLQYKKSQWPKQQLGQWDGGAYCIRLGFCVGTLKNASLQMPLYWLLVLLGTLIMHFLFLIENTEAVLKVILVDGRNRSNTAQCKEYWP